jgi:hypothetical protein
MKLPSQIPTDLKFWLLAIINHEKRQRAFGEQTLSRRERALDFVQCVTCQSIRHLLDALMYNRFHYLHFVELDQSIENLREVLILEGFQYFRIGGPDKTLPLRFQVRFQVGEGAHQLAFRRFEAEAINRVEGSPEWLAIQKRRDRLARDLRTSMSGAAQFAFPPHCASAPQTAEHARSANRKRLIDPILEGKGLTRSRWAQFAGVDDEVVHRFLGGQTIALRPASRRALAEALKMPLDDFPH